MEEKLKEIYKLMEDAESEMNYWRDHTENDNCIFNQSDLWERRYKTLSETIEILER